MPRHSRKAPAAPRFVKITLTVPMSLTDAVTGVLWALGVEGVTIDDDETRAHPHAKNVVKTGLATIDGTFTHQRGLESRALKALQPVLAAAEQAQQTVELVWSNVPDEDWNARWKQQWKPMRIAKHIVVVPTWEAESHRAGTGDVVIVMDPGMAFGTGTHETTQLCTAEIERLFEARAFESVLDVGTGSGVLAIAAALLGERAGKPVKRILGVDIDPDSVRVAAENALANACRIEVAATPVDKLRGRFELVVANILLDPLRVLARDLVRLTAGDGVLVLSGILESQRAELEETYAAAGMRKVANHAAGEWASVRFQRS